MQQIKKLEMIHKPDIKAIILIDLNDKTGAIIEQFHLNDDLNDRLSKNEMSEEYVTEELRDFYQKCSKIILESKTPTTIMKDEDVVVADGGVDVRNLTAKSYRQLEYTALNNQLYCAEMIKNQLIKQNNLLEKIANQLFIDIEALKNQYIEASNVKIPNIDLTALSERQYQQKKFEVQSALLETNIVNANNTRYIVVLLSLLNEVMGVDLRHGPKNEQNQC